MIFRKAVPRANQVYHGAPPRLTGNHYLMTLGGSQTKIETIMYHTGMYEGISVTITLRGQQ